MIQLRSLLDISLESLTLTAVIDSALCVGAGGSTGSLADKPIVRTASGQLLIPASQLKGRLRHECEKIGRSLGWEICRSPNAETMCPQRRGLAGNFSRAEYWLEKPELASLQDEQKYHCLVCQVFGNPVLAAHVIFDDLICETPAKTLPEVMRSGVTLNRKRHTAEDQKLFLLETSPVNAQLRFQGEIHLLKGCPNYTKVLLLAGLHHIHALGGSKSAGLGWLHWQGLTDWSLDQSAWDELAKGVAP